MEYQINISYKFSASSLKEAEEKALSYVQSNLTVNPLKALVCSPADIAEKCEDFRKAEKELFVAFCLDTQNQITYKEIVSIGTLNTSLVHPRECFKMAIRQNACSVIFVHNHPSGSLEPSAEDLEVTKRLADAGKLLGIEVLDHVIVTREAHTSLKERNLI